MCNLVTGGFLAGKNKQTPSRTNKTPTTAADRFIPNRSATQFDLGHFLVSGQRMGGTEDETLSPSKREFRQAMSDNLNGDTANTKIIAYKNKAPEAPEGRK